MPVIRCPSSHCGCGLCAPKALNEQDAKEIFEQRTKYIELVFKKKKKKKKKKRNRSLRGKTIWTRFKEIYVDVSKILIFLFHCTIYYRSLQSFFIPSKDVPFLTLKLDYLHVCKNVFVQIVQASHSHLQNRFISKLTAAREARCTYS